MDLTLAQALRLAGGPGSTGAAAHSVAFVGAGGKTTAVFQLARQLRRPVVVTTTTHLGAWQLSLANQHIILAAGELPPAEPPPGVTVLTGPQASPAPDGLERFGPVSEGVLRWLHDRAPWNRAVVLVEADGAHRKPIKAPVAYEPVIPPHMGMVMVLQGLSGLGKPLSDEFVHRPEQFAALSGLEIGEPVTAAGLLRVLTHAQGGLKGMPAPAQRVVLLNQADDADLQAQAKSMVPALLHHYQAVIIASLGAGMLHAVYEPVAGVVLAAGGSTRLGRPKPLLDWRGQPFVRAVAQTAVSAGLEPVVVVTGAEAGDVEQALAGLPVQVVHNEAWESGQASSIRAGLRALPAGTGAAVFLLADQPQVGADVIAALVDRHATQLDPIVAPLVMLEKRGNPVLFDRVTFPDLMALEGDVGGRAVFSRHHVEYLPWYDERLLLDVDTEQDYRRLLEEDRS